MKNNKIFMFILLILGLSVGINAVSVTDNNDAIMTVSANAGGGGFIIYANVDTSGEITVTRASANTNSDDWELHASDGTTKGILLASNYSNTNTNITFNYELVAGNYYLITTDRGGISYNRAIVACSFPINRVNINFHDGWHDGLGSTSATCFNIQSITTSTPIVSPTLTFTNITADNVTLINNTFYNDTIQFQTFVLNTSTNDLVNHTYSLNGNTSIQYATNNLNGSLNLNLSEGYYNISFQAINNETNVNSTNYSFIIDRTAPVINIIGNLTQNTFFVNFSQIFAVNYSISGKKSCSFNITYLSANESDSNFLIDCEDTQLFTRAGLYNGFLTAEDNAGNIVTGSVNGTIDPNINLFFNQSNGTILLNYTAIIFHPDGRSTIPTVQGDGSIQLSPINNGTLDLGLHTIQFSKLGFATENFTQIVNATNAGINTTFNVISSKIILSIFDRQTNNLLTGTTLITLIAGVGFNGSTTTGLLNISNINFIPNGYQIIAEHTGYATELITFNYNNQELLNVNMYLLNETSIVYGTIILKAIADTGELINEATCSALEWKSSESAYVSIATGLTNINGETTLNIELGVKNYKFTCTKEGVTSISTPQIIQTTGTTIPIILDTAELIPSPFLENIIFSFINTTENATHERITFTWADTDGLVTQGCIYVYKVRGTSKTLLTTPVCVSGAISQKQILIDVNQTFNTVAYAVVTVNGLDTNLDNIIFQGSSSISNSLKTNNLALIIPFLFAVIGLVLGFMIKPQNIYMSIIGMFIGIWFGVSIITDIIPKGTVYFISVMLLLMFWGAYKFK